jgi:hypothetical protein
VSDELFDKLWAFEEILRVTVKSFHVPLVYKFIADPTTDIASTKP